MTPSEDSTKTIARFTEQIEHLHGMNNGLYEENLLLHEEIAALKARLAEAARLVSGYEKIFSSSYLPPADTAGDDYSWLVAAEKDKHGH